MMPAEMNFISIFTRTYFVTDVTMPAFRLYMLGFHVVLHGLAGFTAVFANTALESLTALVVQRPDSHD